MRKTLWVLGAVGHVALLTESDLIYLVNLYCGGLTAVTVAVVGVPYLLSVRSKGAERMVISASLMFSQ